MAVSTALSGVGRISEASRIRIKAIAKEMGWRPSLLATSLRRKRS
jgi:DNA-binding LacI/PurR family transcriptional regulator